MCGIAASCIAESQDTGSSTSASSRMMAQDLKEYVIDKHIELPISSTYLIDLLILLFLFLCFYIKQWPSSHRGFASSDGSSAETA